VKESPSFTQILRLLPSISQHQARHLLGPPGPPGPGRGVRLHGLLTAIILVLASGCATFIHGTAVAQQAGKVQPRSALEPNIGTREVSEDLRRKIKETVLLARSAFQTPDRPLHQWGDPDQISGVYEPSMRYFVDQIGDDVFMHVAMGYGPPATHPTRLRLITIMLYGPMICLPSEQAIIEWLGEPMKVSEVVLGKRFDYRGQDRAKLRVLGVEFDMFRRALQKPGRIAPGEEPLWQCSGSDQAASTLREKDPARWSRYREERRDSAVEFKIFFAPH